MPNTVCRSCGDSNLLPILSLGRTPLANSLLTDADLEKPERRYPLDVAFCPACALVQLLDSIPPVQLFREYLYLSSFSDTAVREARNLVERIVRSRRLGVNSLAVEIASNDGYLLQHYRPLGVAVLGIEPALNIAQVAEKERGIPTIPEFFSSDLAKQIRKQHGSADVIHANNVLAHVADLNDVVEGMAILLGDSGIGVLEVPYVRDLIENVEFDTIYHEHLCYFSLIALNRLFGRHDLAIVDVERIPIHGGSLRLFVTRRAGAVPDSVPTSASVTAMLLEEAECGMHLHPFYKDFALRVDVLRRDLTQFLRRLKSDGRSIAAYGASAKGSTLLNYAGIGAETLDFVVDRSTVKQRRFMPGVRLPIYAPESLVQEMPDYVLLLTWNFADEILSQQIEYRQRGGRFIVPIPQVRVA